MTRRRTSRRARKTRQYVGWDMERKFRRRSLAFVLCMAATVVPAQTARQYYDRGVEKQRRADYYGAGEDFHEALRINASYADAWFSLAQVTYELDDYNLALTYLDNAEKYARDKLEIQNLRGLTYIALNRLDDARAVFGAMLKKAPNDVNARFGLAELDLFAGRYDAAKSRYADALKRQADNRKALLSLALLSAETGNDRAAQDYVQQALYYHGADAQVHYLAAYLAARVGNLDEAERRARAAVQIDGDFVKAYVLLASVLFAQARYDEVIDIGDYLIARERGTVSAWYLKGLCQVRQGNDEAAIATWATALTIDEHDEVMRSALELLVMRTTQVEDARRAQWAAYHLKKGRDYARLFMGEEARYEYQRALKINPNDARTRDEFAALLSQVGLNELYLQQLKFISEHERAPDGGDADEAESYRKIRMADTIEAYDSLLKYSLNNAWDIDPFYLDKTRWHVGLYYTDSPVQLLHSEVEHISAEMIQDIFTGVAITSVEVRNHPVSGYGEAFRLAREGGMDYFVMLTVDETEREVAMNAVIYSARTGVELTRFGLFRTGNDKYASVLRSFRRNLLAMLPVRGKIIARSVNEVLVDIGKVEGMTENTVLDVIKAGAVRTKDSTVGVEFTRDALLGTITVKRVGEEIAQGTLRQKGFYDRVNVGDEVLVKSMPAPAGTAADTAPAADEDGKPVAGKGKDEKDARSTAERLGLVRTPAILEIIRSIK